MDNTIKTGVSPRFALAEAARIESADPGAFDDRYARLIKLFNAWGLTDNEVSGFFGVMSIDDEIIKMFAAGHTTSWQDFQARYDAIIRLKTAVYDLTEHNASKAADFLRQHILVGKCCPLIVEIANSTASVLADIAAVLEKGISS